MNSGRTRERENTTSYDDLDESEAEKLEIAYRFNIESEDAANFAGVNEEVAEEFYDGADFSRVELSANESPQRRLRALRGFFNEYQRDVSSSRPPFSGVTYDTKAKMQAAGIELTDEEEIEMRSRGSPEDRAKVRKMELLNDTKEYEEDVDPKAAAYALIEHKNGATSEDIADFFHEDLDFWRGEPSQEWREERVEELFEAEAEHYREEDAENQLWFTTRTDEKDLKFSYGDKKEEIEVYTPSSGFNPLKNTPEGQSQLIEDKVERWTADPENWKVDASP
ncbi:MAG: hypothetical protein ABEK16_01565 [Candidatus Nanohalobium sp.]